MNDQRDHADLRSRGYESAAPAPHPPPAFRCVINPRQSDARRASSKQHGKELQARWLAVNEQPKTRRGYSTGYVAGSLFTLLVGEHLEQLDADDAGLDVLIEVTQPLGARLDKVGAPPARERLLLLLILQLALCADARLALTGFEGRHLTRGDRCEILQGDVAV
eukprot:6182045-Pleurochrysis_carterae.AAC.4